MLNFGKILFGIISAKIKEIINKRFSAIVVWIFLIIKYKGKNIGMINFDKLDETFSIVINKDYRNGGRLGLGGLGFRAWKLLLKYLKKALKIKEVR